MSRGLGTMQRHILYYYDRAVPNATGMPIDHDVWGEQYAESEVCPVRRLRADVAFACYGGWRGQKIGKAFEPSFSRALHKLVECGALVPVLFMQRLALLLFSPSGDSQ